MLRRTRRRWLFYAVVAAACAAVVSDWPTGLASGFWAEHAMLGGLVSGLILFGAAAFVIEEWIAEREAAQWDRAAGVAFYDLARTMLVVARGLEQITGSRRYEHRGTPGLPESQAAPTVEYVRGLRTSLPEDLRVRVRALSDDDGWLRLAHRALQDLKNQAADTISRWAAVLLATDRLARELNEVSRITQAIEQLDQIMLPHLDGVDGDAWRDELAREWVRLQGEAQSSRDRLLAASKPPEPISRAAASPGPRR